MREKELDFSNTIFKLRTERGYTQLSVAEHIGVDSSTYSKMEKGTIGVSIEKLAKIAAFYHLSLIDIIAYPKKYICTDDLNGSAQEKEKQKVLLQIELTEEKREQVLKIVLGNGHSDILK